jgi:hypothetical protein
MPKKKIVDGGMPQISDIGQGAAAPAGDGKAAPAPTSAWVTQTVAGRVGAPRREARTDIRQRQTGAAGGTDEATLS